MCFLAYNFCWKWLLDLLTTMYRALLLAPPTRKRCIIFLKSNAPFFGSEEVCFNIIRWMFVLNARPYFCFPFSKICFSSVFALSRESCINKTKTIQRESILQYYLQKISDVTSGRHPKWNRKSNIAFSSNDVTQK